MPKRFQIKGKILEVRQGIMAINKIGVMAILLCGMILLGSNVEVKAVQPLALKMFVGQPEKPCPLICILVKYVTCDGKKSYPVCTNCCLSAGCTLHFASGDSQYCEPDPAKY